LIAKGCNLRFVSIADVLSQVLIQTFVFLLVFGNQSVEQAFSNVKSFVFRLIFHQRKILVSHFQSFSEKAGFSVDEFGH